MASNMDEKKSGLLTRRQALLSIATITAGAAVAPRLVFGATPAKDKIKFLAIGDFGTGDDNQTGIAAQMLRDHKTSPLDFVLAVGDNIYPDGGGRHFAKKFERPYSGLIREGVKFHAVLGNHDVKDGRRDQCQYPLFNMNGQCYYTVKKGDGLAEFFMIDSTDFDMAQVGWLEGVLKESAAKWKIAVFHHPIYSSGEEHGSSLGLRSRIEPLLSRYGVNVAISGHDHIYERVKPQQGVQYFVSGAGGKVRPGDVNMGSPFRAMSFDRDNHYLQMIIEDQQISFQSITRGGSVIDRGAITPRAMVASVR
ncbi:MAG TPA: metallophosphoesterase [Blastocatellia bacterium]|nr:metallophosphoesterase [Blastocatellia bacterium]